jgi:heptose I phosphotransferase
MKAESIDDGRMTVTVDFLPLLRANGLDSFEKVMAMTDGKVFRDFPGRRTVRLELNHDGAAQAIFLKRYESEYLSPARKWLRRLHWPGAEDEALREWRVIHEVRSRGIPTATPVAFGQQTAGRAATRSFLMTAEIPGAVEGIAWAEQLPAPERRRFLLRVANLGRRFHATGLAHKDFYLGHFLVSTLRNRSGQWAGETLENASRGADEPELFLIDLQRAVRPCCFHERWVEKDLGALAYSMYNAGASWTDLLRCHLAYCGKRGLDEPEKRVVRAVLRRVAWLRTRQPRHDGPVKQRT